MQSDSDNLADLEPLNADADSEEDADSKADMAYTLSNGEDDAEDLVSPSHGYGSYKEVTEEEDEISNAETDKEMVEDVVHIFSSENSKAENITS